MVSNPGAPAGGAAAPAPATATQGATDGTTRDSGQRRNRGRFNRGSAGRSQRPPLRKFIGKEESLGDEYVYQHTEGRDASDQYASTTEEIIRYSSTKYKNGADVGRSLADGVKLVVTMPPAPTAVAPAVVQDTDVMIWKMQVQLVLHRMSALDSNLQSAYALVRGQCSKPILEKVESQQGYVTIHQDRDPIGLLGLIKAVMFNYNSRKYRGVAIIDIIKPNIVSQTRYMSDSEYLEKFRTQLDVLKAAGGEVCQHPGLLKDELERAQATDPPTQQETADATSSARKRFEGTLFLMKSNQVKYGRLVQELANDYNKGRDSYPETLTGAYEMMLHDVRDQDSQPQPHGSGGMAFGTVDEQSRPGSNTQPNPRPDVTCFKCGRAGHFSNRCQETEHVNGTALVVTETALCNVAGDDEAPSDEEAADEEDASDGGDDDIEEVNLATLGDESDASDSTHTRTVGFSFLHFGVIVESPEPCELNFLNDGVVAESYEQHGINNGRAVPTTWILLDNQSTVDVFCNENLLEDIREAPIPCRISCNAGVVEVNMIGDLPGYPAPVWFHPNGIANILSLHRVAQYCRVQYDSGEYRAAFHVTKSDGSIRDFVPALTGLHYCETAQHESVLVNTVAEKKSHYTVRAYKQAMVARRIQDTIGRPWTRDYVKIVEGGSLRNCPIIRADIAAAEDILGPNLGSLKGKTVRRKGAHVPSLVADVPYQIIKMYRNVTLCFDIMFVNKIAFLVTVSRHIRFGTTERLLSRQAGVVAKALISVIYFYRQRGFRVKECNGDGEFAPIRGDLAEPKVNAQLNVTAEDEHVPEVERYIRTIKERTRAVYNTSPFKKIPVMMIVEMVHASNFWLNMFPANDGVSAVQSPRRIMTGQYGDYNLHCTPL
jgi:hypothetical protein